MEIKTYTEHVEFDRDVKEYIAFDGRVFMHEDACIMYEDRLRKQMEIDAHPVSKSIRNLSYWPEWDVSARLCYLSSEEDHEFLKKHYVADICTKDDFEAFGPGFYAFWDEDNGDWPSTYYLYNVDGYIRKMEFELAEWKNNVLALEQDIVFKTIHPTGVDTIETSVL